MISSEYISNHQKHAYVQIACSFELYAYETESITFLALDVSCLGRGFQLEQEETLLFYFYILGEK